MAHWGLVRLVQGDAFGERFYGSRANAPFQRGPTLPEVNAPTAEDTGRFNLGWTVLHEAAHECNLAKAVEVKPHRSATSAILPRL